MRGCWSGAALGLDLTGMITGAQRRLTSDELNRLEEFARRRLAGEPVARILGAEGILGTAADNSRGDAGAAARHRDGGRTGARNAARRRKRCRSAVAHRRSRHRLRRDPAGVAVRIAGGARLRDRHQRGGAANRRQTMRRDWGSSDRATFIACDYASGLSGPFDLIVSNPPYIRSADIERSRAARSGITTRAPRSTAAPTGLMPIARWSHRRRAFWCRAPCWSWRPGRARAARLRP